MNRQKVAVNNKPVGLLLLTDEQESMIDRYLPCGDMFILSDNGGTETRSILTMQYRFSTGASIFVSGTPLLKKRKKKFILLDETMVKIKNM